MSSNDGTNHESIDRQLGAGATDRKRTGGLDGAVEVSPPHDDEATVTVAGHWFDDEDAYVQLQILVGVTETRLALSPEKARDLAADLSDAADTAIRGDAELGDEDE